MWAQQVLSTRQGGICICVIMYTNCACVSVKHKKVVSVCIRYCTYIVLAVMCIYVIYKCLSRDSNQQLDLGKSS